MRTHTYAFAVVYRVFPFDPFTILHHGQKLKVSELWKFPEVITSTAWAKRSQISAFVRYL